MRLVMLKEPISVGTQRQLLLDDHLIERMESLRRVVNRPVKHPSNPLPIADKPWESGCSIYGTVIYKPSEGFFRMYYLTTPRDRGDKPLDLGRGHVRAPHTTLAAYATSRDGVTWEKPSLGQFNYDGGNQNNLLDLGLYNCEGLAVLFDPEDPDPTRRYKAFYWDHGSGGFTLRDGRPYCLDGPLDGIHVAFSSDGLRWAPHKGNPVIRRYCDTDQAVVWDPQLGLFVAFSRFGFGRRVARSVSKDFMMWSEPELVLECDEADGPGTQIYGMPVTIYEGIYVGMLWIYREGGDGCIETQLACSRDGIHWVRVGDRQIFLPLGPADSWEGGMVRAGDIIRQGDQLYIYYGGVRGPHTGPRFPKVERKHRPAIGLATLRLDGFASIDAGEEEGTLTTKPLLFDGSRLVVNADAKTGYIMVEILDGERPLEIPLQGFSRADCQAISADSVCHSVAWRTESVLSALRGKIVRLKFYICNAKLYAFSVR